MHDIFKQSHKKCSRAHLQEDQDFWEKVVASIDKEVPKQFLSEFDTRYPFGFDPNKSKAKPQMWSVFLEGKMQHPSKLVIAKVTIHRDHGPARWNHKSKKNTINLLLTAKNSQVQDEAPLAFKVQAALFLGAEPSLTYFSDVM